MKTTLPIQKVFRTWLFLCLFETLSISASAQTVKQQTLHHIRHLFSVYPPVQLPFSCKIQGNASSVTEIYADNENDTLVFGNMGPVSIIGIIPDTSSYFCFFYMVHADNLLPCVVTYDKKGNQLSSKVLGESCWQGAESDCATFVTVSPDLKIVSDYSEFLYEEDAGGNYGNSPNEASGYVEYSEIGPTGKIVVTRKIIKTREELLKNPIVHE